MDRNKPPTGVRGPKGKITQHPSDLFALGSKPSSASRDVEAKRTALSKLTTSTHSSLASSSKERKREPTSTALPSVPSSKKAKVVAAALAVTRPGPTALGAPSERFTTTTVSTSVSEPWESLAVDCEETEFTVQILNSVADGDTDTAVGYVLGGLRTLKSQRYKPELILVNSLSYIVKANPLLIRNDVVMQALCSLLRKDSGHTFKSKGNPVLPVLSVNMLMRAFQDVYTWPDLFVKCYLEDALGDRIWVDHDLCSSFAENIMTAFSTRIPPKSLLQPELSALGGRGDTSSPLTINEDDPMEGSSGKKKYTLEKCNIPVYSRFTQSVESIEETVLEAVKEQLSRRQAPETVTKNFLRFLSTSCGLVEIRIIAVSRLEMWLQNAKLMRSAQELLTYLCYNCAATTQRDVEVISQLVKIRLKTKALVNVYLNCLREMIIVHPENLPLILKHTIYNELSNSRNPNNMPVIAVIFQSSPEAAANSLAEIFMELLLNKDDYLRPLRALLREIIRVLRYDIDMHLICHALIRERKETTVLIRDFEFRERIFVSVADLICLCMFLAVSPQVREVANMVSRGDKKDIGVLQKFQLQIAKIQRDAVWWLHDSVPRIYRPTAQDFVASLRKILLLEPIDVYCKIDMWPAENDRNIMMRLISEVPLLQATLIRILIIGLSKDHPLLQVETLDFCDPLVKRAAMQSSEGVPMLQVDKLEIIDLIFNLCTYHHPENISLPIGYTPPQLAISNQYWKGWIILLILAAHNPTTFGSVAWEKYPTLRIFMEMCITNHFTYPPPTMAMCDNFEELKMKELQIAALEKQQILEFESHLAAASTKATITEHNSLLLPQLITMVPMGTSRRPPPTILEQLNALNTSHRLGHLLCRSRRPDFLLDIIQRQGPSQHMPWLADLVQNSEGALSHLPVQCLCEFLLSSGLMTGERGDRVMRHKHDQLVNHLHSLLTSKDTPHEPACEVLEYFLRRLVSPHYSSRAQAIKGIKLVLQSTDEDSMDVDQSETSTESCNDPWLIRQFPALPHFTAFRSQVVLALRQACQVENDPEHVSSYIRFLACHTAEDHLSEMLDLVLDMAQLIVERSTIIAAILPTSDDDSSVTVSTLQSLMSIFCIYLQKAREPRKEAYQWSECQDQILVQWASGEECIMHILVLHAMIILLTYGPASGTDSQLFDTLLETWFPINQEQPKAFLVDTSEEALLIPDWLKLRMIRSHVERLVDAALIDLEPAQLVLFIQSFGIPVASMSKLLHALDSAVTSDQCSVDDAVLDKAYMAQLVEVQHRRGATGGDIYVKVLQLHQPDFPDELDNTPLLWKRSLSDTKIIKHSQSVLEITQVNSLLSGIFLNEIYIGDKQKDFRLLIKTLATEIRTSNFIVFKSVLQYFIIHRELTKFIESLLAVKHYSNLLLNVIFTKNTDVLISMFSDTARLIYNRIKSDSSVALILKKFIDSIDRKDLKLTKIKKENEKDMFLYGENKLLHRNYINSNNVEKLTKMLLMTKISDISYKNNFENTGLLVDKLASIEPELIGSCPELQIDLLFLKVDAKSGNVSKLFRPYLLTLLIHRAGWATLHQCIGHLLNETSSKYDATDVLDFLTALTQNPKLWQGKDKFTPKHYKPEDILELSNTELKSLVRYMLQEALMSIKKSTDDLKKAISCLEQRLPLLLQCIDENYIAVSCVTRYLLSLIKSDDEKKIKVEDNIITIDDVDSEIDDLKYTYSHMAEQFLLLLYMYVPKVIHYVVGSYRQKIFEKAHVAGWSSSTVDKISHCLLTALAATPTSKDWSRRSQEYELMARKMAAVHPILILRQLPMIASSLRGRTHLEFNVFRSRNHLNLFTQILGIIELLQPQVFMTEYKEGIETSLHEYFILFRYHGHLKELLSLLTRFVIILQGYINFDAKRALKYLQKYAHLLNDLQIMHSNILPLRDLMSGILLPRNESDIVDQDGDDVLVAVVPPAAPEQLPQHWDQLVSSLAKVQGEEVLSALQDIDHLSNRKPGILNNILTDICKLVESPMTNIRSLAHALLAKYLKHNPSSETATCIILTSILHCLDSPNSDIVVTTLDRLPELTVCMQENAIPILQKAFTLGMGSDINTIDNINKTIALLNLQIGC